MAPSPNTSASASLAVMRDGDATEGFSSARRSGPPVLPRPRLATKHRHALAAPSAWGREGEGARGGPKDPSGAPWCFRAYRSGRSPETRRGDLFLLVVPGLNLLLLLGTGRIWSVVGVVRAFWRVKDHIPTGSQKRVASEYVISFGGNAGLAPARQIL